MDPTTQDPNIQDPNAGGQAAPPVPETPAFHAMFNERFQTSFEDDAQIQDWYRQASAPKEPTYRHPFVKDIDDYLSHEDFADPGKAMEGVYGYIRTQTTPWAKMAEESPVNVLVEKAVAETPGLNRERAMRGISANYRISPEDYDQYDYTDPAHKEKVDALINKEKDRLYLDATAAANALEGRKKQYSEHPAKAAQRQRDAEAAEFGKQYKSQAQGEARSLKEVQIGESKFPVSVFDERGKAMPNSHVEAAMEDPYKFLAMVSQSNGGFDPAKIIKLAAILDNLPKFMESVTKTAAADATKTVLNTAQNVTVPGTQAAPNGRPQLIPIPPRG